MTEQQEELRCLAVTTLAGHELEIRSEKGDRRQYRLIRKVGAGKNAVTWEATDWLDRSWALKFVLRADYQTHSLEAEARRVSRLTTEYIAQIDFYGIPSFEVDGVDDDLYYAIVVRWVGGDTLEDYLEKNADQMGVEKLLYFARAMCEVLKDLADHGLTHNDLHEGNIMLSSTTSLLTGEDLAHVVVIDTGTLKTEDRRHALLEKWRTELNAVREASTQTSADLASTIEALQRKIDWFSRTDQEWFVCHLCSIHNLLMRRLPELDTSSRIFLRRLSDSLDRMDDPDPSRRMDDPRQMYEELDRLWQEANQLDKPKMVSPFDLMSAELIRSDRQLMDLFADEFPGLSQCRSSDPTYVYGMRGCGKSTILRSMSLKALLQSKDPVSALSRISFIGVYISCSSELRSRFWLMNEDDYDVLEGHVVMFFNMLLLEALLETLDVMFHWDRHRESEFRFGVTTVAAAKFCAFVRGKLQLNGVKPRVGNGSSFAALRSEVRRTRDILWSRILDRDEPHMRTDAQLVFDICEHLTDLFPIFQERQLAFLLDDYSNQRIPARLQQKLNQAITFSKQGSPIFKVTSEYGGVDLSGIQEGREVREVNVGLEHVKLQNADRWQFLRNLINKRFAYLGHPIDIAKILPPSGLGPSIPMAKAIRECFQGNQRFHYHGIDTISDLCSGDFAMGLDVVRRILEEGRADWRDAQPLAASVQHRAIERYSRREHEYLRYLSPGGREKHELVDRLCWLGREAVLKRDTVKDGKQIPLIKIHLDITESALSALEQHDQEHWELLMDLVWRGVLFPLDTSKSREAHEGTRRFQVRRILLPRYGAPLGRHTPIRIDTHEKLRFLLTEPGDFVNDELRGQRRLAEVVQEAAGT